MNSSFDLLAQIFYEDTPIDRDRFYMLLDDVGVPPSTCWRTIYRMIFDAGINFHPGVDRTKSKDRLEAVMHQSLEIAKTQNFVEKELLELMQNYNTAFVAVCHKDLSDALNELDSFTKEFKSICLNRQGNIEVLEKETLRTVASKSNIKEKIRQIKVRFKQTIEQFKADVVKLDHMNNTDHLTGLYNRRFFDKQLDQEVTQALREKTWLHLLMIDIDDFKRFNDTYGHVIGDQALKTVAKHIRMVCHDESDATGIYFFPTRYGGEEFSVILPAVEKNQAAAIAETIREAIANYTFVIRTTEGTIKHKGLSLTVSIGVADLVHESKNSPGTPENLVKQADAAMFSAKKKGKNQVCTSIA